MEMVKSHWPNVAKSYHPLKMSLVVIILFSLLSFKESRHSILDISDLSMELLAEMARLNVVAWKDCCDTIWFLRSLIKEIQSYGSAAVMEC